MRPSHACASIITMGLFLSACDQSQTPPPRQEVSVVEKSPGELPPLEFDLAASLDRSSGLNWPQVGSEQSQYWAHETPARIHVKHQGRTLIESYSRITFAEQRDARLVHISITPLVSAVPLPDAIEYVIEKILGALAPGDDAALARAQSWQASIASGQAPDSTTLRFDCPEIEVEGFCEIRSTSDPQNLGRNYISLGLYDRLVFGRK